MYLIVNLKDTKKAAFIRGFWKGMAAPLMLYGTFDLPEQLKNRSFQELPKRLSSHGSDWVKVGNALRAAAKKAHESQDPS
jgi:hypothetical protein